MAKAVTVKVEGLRDFERALAEFKPATSKAIARRTLLKAAAPMVDEAKRLVSVEYGDLRDSITAQVESRGAAGKAAFAAAMRSGQGTEAARGAARTANRGASDRSTVTVAVGPGRNPQGIQQEFGNQRHAPQPYIRPAWDSGKNKALDSIAEIMGDEIAKAAKRAARKAAKGKG